MSENAYELVNSLFNKHGISPLSTYLIIKKIESTSFENLEMSIDKLSRTHDISKQSMCQTIESYFKKYKKSLKTEKQVGEKFLDILSRISTDASNLSGRNHIDNSAKKFEIFSFENNFCNHNIEKVSNEISKSDSTILRKHLSSTNYFNKIKEQVDAIKCNNKRKFSESMETLEACEVETKVESSEKKLKTELVQSENLNNATNMIIGLINESTNQNLETNLNKSLNEMANINECIMALTESILIYENKKIIHDINSSSTSLHRSMSSRNSKISKNRCVVDILLDYLCHFDPQIINKEFEIEYRLLFELRGGILSDTSVSTSKSLDKNQLTTSDITQSFLLSLFIHQANWEKLFRCMQLLLNNHSFFSQNEMGF